MKMRGETDIVIEIPDFLHHTYSIILVIHYSLQLIDNFIVYKIIIHTNKVIFTAPFNILVCL